MLNPLGLTGRCTEHENVLIVVVVVSPSLPQTLEADLVEAGVVTRKPTTLGETKGHQHTRGGTNTQYNRQTTALRSHRPLAGGCRCGMQLQCNVVWNCSSLTFALPRTVKVTLAFPVDHRAGETMGNSTDSTTQWTWSSLCRSPVVACAYACSYPAAIPQLSRSYPAAAMQETKRPLSALSPCFANRVYGWRSFTWWRSGTPAHSRGRGVCLAAARRPRWMRKRRVQGASEASRRRARRVRRARRARASVGRSPFQLHEPT